MVAEDDPNVFHTDIEVVTPPQLFIYSRTNYSKIYKSTHSPWKKKSVIIK